MELTYAREKHPCLALAKSVLYHQDELFQSFLCQEWWQTTTWPSAACDPWYDGRISEGMGSAKVSQTRMTLANVFGTLKAQGQNRYIGCLGLLRTDS